MLKWIKRFFGLDYNDKNVNTHHGVGYSGVTASSSEVAPSVHATVETAVAEAPIVSVVSAPIKEKKPRKSAVKKAAPKKTTKKK